MSDTYFGKKHDILCNCGTVFRGHVEKYCDKCKSGMHDPMLGLSRYIKNSKKLESIGILDKRTR